MSVAGSHVPLSCSSGRNELAQIEMKVFSRAVVYCLVVTQLWACSGRKVNENDPADLFQEAESEIKSDRYIIAIEKLRVIKNKFPYSSFSSKAQLRIADVYFLQDSFLEAAVAYETFRDLHPKHESSAYAFYRTAESYLLDAPSNPARDLTSLSLALQNFERFLKTYPSDERTAQARTKIQEIRVRLASKELLIANFYERTNVPSSAIRRYRKVTELYPETPQAAEAHDRLAQLEVKTP